MSRRWAILATLSAFFAATGVAAGDEELTLTRAVEIARHRSPAVRAARANAASEAAQEDVVRANYYPSLTAQVTGQGAAARTVNPANNGTLFTAVVYSAGGQGQVNAQWTLYDFGHTAGLVDNAEGQRLGAVAGVGVADWTVIANTANAYVTLVYSEELRDVTKATLDQRERMVTIAKGLIKAGLQPPLEEIRSIARAEAARRDLATAEAALVDARIVLAAYLGLDPKTAIRATVPHLARLDIDVRTAMKMAEHVPAVVLADAAVTQYQGTVDANVAQYRPTLSFAGNGSYTFNRYDSLAATLTQSSASGQLLLSVPIFEPNIAPSVTAAKELVANAVGTADQARQDAREEAARAVAAIELVGSQLEYARKAADGAAGVLTMVQARYIQGLSSPIELIDAETADAAARIARTQAEQAYQLAIVREYVAVARKIAEEGS
jgi:multidrug efflux system outer membrane protein